MNIWIQGILTGLLTGIVLVTMAIVLTRPVLGWVFGKLFLRIAADPYWENLFATYNITSRANMGDAAGPSERTSTVPRPPLAFGTRRSRSPWSEIVFNPVYLHRESTLDAEAVETHLVIGPAAARPLRLEIPILIGGMGYATALSSQAKQALAMGATKVGTASNTGDGAPLEQERAAAERLIVQYTAGSSLGKQADQLKTANAVEIQLSRGRYGPSLEASPRRLSTEERLRRVMGYLPGDGTEAASRLAAVRSSSDLRQLVEDLRRDCGGVPVGVKVGATQWMEAELAKIIEAEVDFISIDGEEGGHHRNSPALLDGVGIPTLYALVRARRFLDRYPDRRISLLIGGGLTGPGIFLKAMALGADGVFIGTAALLAIVQAQAGKIPPWESPTSLVFYDSRLARRFDPFAGAQSLAGFLRNSLREMRRTALITGHSRLRDVNRRDLCTTNRALAEWLDIPWAGVAPPLD